MSAVIYVCLWFLVCKVRCCALGAHAKNINGAGVVREAWPLAVWQGTGDLHGLVSCGLDSEAALGVSDASDADAW